MKSEGVVINSFDYKETSKIIHLYTIDGKMSVEAVGANNPKKGLLGFTEIGNTVSFITTDGKIKKVVEYEVLNSLYDISLDLLRVKCFMVILDIIKNIPEDTNHNLLYPYIKQTFKDIRDKNPKKLLSIFLIKMLYVFGIKPNLTSCIHCGSLDIKYLDLLNGGAVCNNCKSISNLESLILFKEYYKEKKDIDLYQDTDYDKLLKDLKEYYSRYASINLKINDIINKN